MSGFMRSKARKGKPELMQFLKGSQGSVTLKIRLLRGEKTNHATSQRELLKQRVNQGQQCEWWEHGWLVQGWMERIAVSGCMSKRESRKR